MPRLVAVLSVLVALSACTGGDASEEPATTVSPVTTLPRPETTQVPPTTAQPSTTSTPEATSDGPVDCAAMADETVELWKSFFAALGDMSAGDLGSERWLEIDATHAIPLETHGIETEAAGCGSARLMLCDRMDELGAGGELADFFAGLVLDECNA